VRFHGTHWTAANCPVCGMRDPKDGDRLILYLKGLGGNLKTKAVCRKCGNIWWPDNKDTEDKSFPIPQKAGPTQEEIRKERRAMFNAWRKMQSGIKPWSKRGLNAENVRLLRLKYTVKEFWWKADGEYVSERIPSLVIPFFSATGKMLNLQYRLLQIPEGIKGKYRWHSRIVPFALFRSRNGTPNERSWMVEGGIKAAVLAQDLRKRGCNDIVYGTSQNSINVAELTGMDAKTLIYIPDPDVWGTGKMENNIKNLLSAGVQDITSLQLPEKIDDLINRIDDVWTNYIISHEEYK